LNDVGEWNQVVARRTESMQEHDGRAITSAPSVRSADKSDLQSTE
jgi:hypothetical protein